MADKGLAIFDLDGTLADTRADLASAVNRTRRVLGLKTISQESVVEAVGNGLVKLLERAIPERRDVPIAEKKAIWMREYTGHWLDRTKAYPGIDRVLCSLKSHGWNLAVLSNKPDVATKAIVEGLGFAKAFTVIQGGAPNIPLKPDPASVDFIIRESGYDGRRSAIWMIGDNYTDLEVARNAGIMSCFCKFGFGHPMSEIPTVVAETADEILVNISI